MVSSQVSLGPQLRKNKQSHVEKTFDPPGDLAVWIAVFALPINSAINPLLYTLSTPQVQAVLKPKLWKLWFNVRSIFRSGQNQEAEAGNDQQGQIMNEEHANNEEGEQIEMQEIEHNEIPEVEAPESPFLQPAMEQACGGDETPSSSDYEDDFDIRPATEKTVEGKELLNKLCQKGEKKREPEQPIEEESKEQVESEEIPLPSDEAENVEEEDKKVLEPDMDTEEEVKETFMVGEKNRRI
ncbi:uncharacterized protein [Pocillopora verrucosa]|uniref:uncharacterized protein n=1 Tax=Pocillopora verrucosa TaxID=203993 RepID=UPI003342C03C